MSYYMIAVLSQHDAELYQQYVAGAAGSLAGYDVKPVSVNARATLFAGDTEADTVAMLEFADEAEFRRWWDSAEYGAVRPLREKSTSTRLIVGVEGAVVLPGLS